jgi:NADH-quinone oxidoreductase subunit M
LVKVWSLFASIITLAVSLSGIWLVKDAKYLEHQGAWLQILGSSFSIKLDAMGQLLCLLTAIGYFLIFTAT